VTGALLGIVILIAGIWVFHSTRPDAENHLQATCSAKTAAIRYSGWYGTFHTFVFANRTYLDAFIAANGRKTMSDVREV
jgi:hypothetical protein